MANWSGDSHDSVAQVRPEHMRNIIAAIPEQDCSPHLLLEGRWPAVCDVRRRREFQATTSATCSIRSSSVAITCRKQADWTKLFNWSVEQSSDDADPKGSHLFANVIQLSGFHHLFGLDRLRDWMPTKAESRSAIETRHPRPK